MAEEDGHVPAGWYPDPLGLPQLRWWDNHAWTEHTSDARQPMVAQETVTAKLAYADDDEYLTTQLREELHTDADTGSPAAEPAFAVADPVLSLEAAPVAMQREEDLSPGLKFAQEHHIEDAPTSAPYLLETSYDDLLGVPIDPAEAQQAQPVFSPSGFDAAPAFATTPAFQFDPQAAAGVGTFTTTNFDPSAFGSFSYAPSVLADAPATPLTRREVMAENGLSINTGPVWIIALMPVIMLVLALMFLVAGDAGRDSTLFAGIILGGSYIATVILAVIDRAMLVRMGHARTANWDWAFLGAPVYLIARMSNVVRETGRGLRPFLTWSALAVLLIGSSVAVPGIVMALAPGVFSEEAEQSIAEQAKAIGANIIVTCPDVPPLLIGDTMTCSAVTSTKVSNVVVSLQRKNGWIDWRVDDWGIYGTNR